MFLWEAVNRRLSGDLNFGGINNDVRLHHWSMGSYIKTQK